MSQVLFAPTLSNWLRDVMNALGNHFPTAEATHVTQSVTPAKVSRFLLCGADFYSISYIKL